MQSRLGTSTDGEVCNAVKVVPPFLIFVGCLPIGLFYPRPGFYNKVVARGLPELTGLHVPFFISKLERIVSYHQVAIIMNLMMTTFLLDKPVTCEPTSSD